jgi:heat shock protein HtpX
VLVAAIFWSLPSQPAIVVPRPPEAVIQADEPNALSAGTGDRTVVCVSLGLLEILDDDELEAVLAHELAHSKNADSTVVTVPGFPTTVAWAMYSTGVDTPPGGRCSSGTSST